MKIKNSKILSKILTEKKLIFAALLVFAPATLPAFAQETLRVGDTVETTDGRQCRVESITGRSAKVRCGPNRSDIRVYSFQSLISPRTAAARREQQQQQQQQKQAQALVNSQAAESKREQDEREEAENKQRWAFHHEAWKYFNTVQILAYFYNPTRYQGGSNTYTPETLKKGIAELAELDALCKSKYVGITNVPNTEQQNSAGQQYADWCAMAAKRDEIDKSARILAAKNIDLFYTIKRDLKESLASREGFINGTVQTLIYDRASWKQKAAAEAKPKFAELGVEMPADYFADVESEADEIKKTIDQTAPTRRFTQPQYQDAASQALAGREFSKMYPGIQVLKIGTDYATWKVYKNKIGIPTDQYKRGWALVKVPNRPYCQAKEWIVRQTYIGGGRFSATMSHFSSGPVGGIFMKCN